MNELARASIMPIPHQPKAPEKTATTNQSATNGDCTPPLCTMSVLVSPRSSRKVATLACVVYFCGAHRYSTKLTAKENPAKMATVSGTYSEAPSGPFENILQKNSARTIPDTSKDASEIRLCQNRVIFIFSMSAPYFEWLCINYSFFLGICK